MGGRTIDPAAITEYYTESHFDYQLIWQLPRSHGLHAGYHDEDHRSHTVAVENMNRVLADRAVVDADDRVLDCGCGVGGSTVWLADNRGATVTGVDLVPMQLRKARSLAREHGVADRVSFGRADFTELPLPDDSFDVLWGIEAICHAPDKHEFVAEAARVLRDGGRLIVSDGFRTAEGMTADERERMDAWLDGWAVPNLTTPDAFRDALADHGFEGVTFEDATDRVMPSSRRLYWAARALGPFERLAHLAGVRSDAQTANRRAARYQHETLTEGLWTYGIVSARRP